MACAGDESPVMVDAHSEAGFAVGTPFGAQGAYDFAQHGHLTRRVADLGAVMLRHRLTAPPEEVGKALTKGSMLFRSGKPVHLPVHTRCCTGGVPALCAVL